MTTYPIIHPDETRICVDGQETPPYEGAAAYVRNTMGEHGIRYDDGYTDWLGTAARAYGDSEVTLHPSEQ